MSTGYDHVEYVKSLDGSSVGIPTLIYRSPDHLLLRLVAVWPLAARHLVNPEMGQEIPDGLPLAARTRYLWAGIQPNPVPIWAAAAGFPAAPHVERAMLQLLDNGVIFLDGTISSWAKSCLDVENKDIGLAPQEEVL